MLGAGWSTGADSGVGWGLTDKSDMLLCLS
jgi:hypothetical protein